MQEFFDIQDYKIRLKVDNLAIKEFKDLIDSDKTKDKRKALDQFLYIYMMYSYDSPYREYPDDIKEKSIIKDVISTESFDAKDNLLVLAIAKYKELHVTPTMALLNSVKNVLYKIAKHMDTTPISSGKDGNITQIQSSIKQVANTSSRYDMLKKQVEKEKDEKGTARGNIKIGNRED